MNFNKYTIKSQEVIQQASEIALGNGQQAIETGHLMKAILTSDENMMGFLLKKLNVNRAQLEPRLNETVTAYPKVSGGNPYLSNEAAAALQKAESLLKEFGDEYVAVEHILLGILTGRDKVAQLLKDAGFTEKELKKAINELRGGAKVTDQNAEAKYKSLERYSINLTERAKAGKIDPVIGRDEEIRRVLQILSRRTKNNPILLGEPGVGKTAIVEGLAQRIVSGDVPENLKEKTLISLDMGLLVAGAKYQKYIEKDKALERRFQAVLVDEPNVQDAISILRGIKEKYEVHHGVRIKDDAVIAAVELSNRYISDRFLPDKAIDLMDEAAAKLRIEIDSLPEELDEIQRRIMQLEIEREAIRRENDRDKEALLSRELADLEEQRNDLKAKWENEKGVIEAIQKEKENIDRYKVEAEQAERSGDYGRVAELRYGRIREAELKLQELQKQVAQTDNALLKEEVTAEDIAEVVAKWTGIPVSRMLQSEREKLLHLEEELGKRVAGQQEAIQVVADAVRRSRAGLQDPKRPIGSFIFLGTTGVGKTELAKALAEFLFNDDNALVRIDMSEYQERHAVSRLIGAPPGYVGYDEGGQLTEAVRRKPYSVILLDEIEKAHPDVFNILLQVLDDGRLTDNKGRVANFKNTIIIMTSNMGSSVIQENFEKMEDWNREQIIEDTKVQVFEMLKKSIRPEFLNRIDELVMFQPLTRKEIRKIVDIQFRQIQQRLAEGGITLESDNEVLKQLGERGFDPQFGARPLKRVMQKLILNELSKDILSGKISKDDVVGMFWDDEAAAIRFFNVAKVEV
jgi:ATP-dependent Clp protease ATP-binding subunit ClpB